MQGVTHPKTDKVADVKSIHLNDASLWQSSNSAQQKRRPNHTSAGRLVTTGLLTTLLTQETVQ